MPRTMTALYPVLTHLTIIICRIGIPSKKAMIPIHDHYDADGIIICGDCDSDTFIIIDQETMQTVKEVMAMDMLIPYNGPADGLPEYWIACKVYRSFQGQRKPKQELVQVNESPGQLPFIDPSLLAIPPTPSAMLNIKIMRNSMKMTDDRTLDLGSDRSRARKKGH